ncbi:Hypothetical predicted protein [Podarcis lilfordi]|uniref:Uncharacterized protein n=1 Tax=Podarcis lilfordi TaxID=74358 RepID=A0AA35PGZ6_9SAUR|nr:Hypothetical predicted protein [Podarcis lilfordi]
MEGRGLLHSQYQPIPVFIWCKQDCSSFAAFWTARQWSGRGAAEEGEVDASVEIPAFQGAGSLATLPSLGLTAKLAADSNKHAHFRVCLEGSLSFHFPSPGFPTALSLL